MVTPVDAHVGRRLGYLRRLRGLSQTDLAKRLGITYQQVQKYEKGINRISASKLYEIARMLEVSVPAFFDEVSLGERGQSSADPVAGSENLPAPSSELLALVKVFVSIENREVRRAVTELVSALAARSSSISVEQPKPGAEVTQLFPKAD